MKQTFIRIYDYYFHHMKLKSKFMLSHLILALAPSLVIAVFSYSQLLNIITHNTLQSLQAISEQTAARVEAKISHIESVITSVGNQDFFIRFIHTQDPSQYSEDSKFKDDLNSFIESANYFIDKESVTDIRIYVDEAHYDYANTYGKSVIFAPMLKAKGTYWHGIFSSTDNNTLICPSIYLSPSEIENCGELAVIRKIPFTSSATDNYAYLAVYYSQNSLDSILLKDSSFTNSVSYIINERDADVSTSNTTLSGLYKLPYGNVTKYISSTLKFESLMIMDTKVYMGYKYISGTDWYMVSAIPASNVFEEGSTLMIQFISLYVFILLVGFIFSLVLSNSIIKRISSVILQMKDVRSKPPVQLEIAGGSDEIGDLIDTYNYMTDEINALLEQKLKAADELRVSEFKALQAQINPHFLYNTLDMINWMSKSGKSNDVSEAVQTLSKFYKLTLNKGNMIAKVKEELEHVFLYVRLQNMRYQNKIHFFIDVPDEMMDFEIPKLIFQPIVENSIQHGIFEKDSKEGNIVIMGWQDEDTLIFVVSDDGVGISPIQMEHLLNGTGKSSTGGSSIGVYNTHSRLQLFYGKNYGLSYRSKIHVETEVEIRIPARKNKR